MFDEPCALLLGGKEIFRLQQTILGSGRLRAWAEWAEKGMEMTSQNTRSSPLAFHLSPSLTHWLLPLRMLILTILLSELKHKQSGSSPNGLRREAFGWQKRSLAVDPFNFRSSLFGWLTSNPSSGQSLCSSLHMCCTHFSDDREPARRSL